MDSIPFLDLKRAWDFYGHEIETSVIRVLRKGIYLNGPETKDLEEELANFIGVRFAIGVSSGTEALYLILRALDLPLGSVILLPSFTFVATAEVVLRAGLKPVFVDIEEDSVNLDPFHLQETYRKCKKEGLKVSGVIAVSLFGIPAKLLEIFEFCKREGLFLIEDICQAFGSSYFGKKVGSFGIANATSFYPTKNLSACGDGGMVFTNDEGLAEKIRILKEHGQSKPYFYEYPGVNGRIDEIQCSILRVKFKYFEREKERRKILAERYEEALRDLLGKVQLLKIPQGGEPVFSIFSLRVTQREALRDYLEKNGIPTRIYYPLPLHLQPLYKKLGYKEGDLPKTEKLSREILSLPFFPYLKEEEVDYIVKKIKAFYGG